MMKIKFRMTRMTFAFALVLVMAATGLWATGAEEEAPATAADTAAKVYVTDPSTGMVVEAPRYGGSLTFATKVADDNLLVDAWVSGGAAWIIGIVNEKLGIIDWAIDRNKHPYFAGYVAPAFALRGALAESWEISGDGLTYTFNIRKGVRWHNKAPMNGRELTAKDIEYNFHRNMGMGKFTEPSTSRGALADLGIASIEATDDMTVVFKLSRPHYQAFQFIMDWYNTWILPPEVIDEHGSIDNWQDLVGTGPYMLVDWVRGTSTTYEKNPDYWGFDEKFPQNRLPYIDTITRLVILDDATRMAALRSGQVDYIGGPAGGSQLRSIDQVDGVRRTNPELVIHTFTERSNTVVRLDTVNPPFNDIRVRQAMQNALDLETMNLTYYKGQGEWTPRGGVAPEYAAQGMTVPYEEWSPELKAKYAYDPELAERLLDEAGLPRGADGVRFRVKYNVHQNADLSFAELQAAYWAEIGVQVDVVNTPAAQVSALLANGPDGTAKYDMATWLGGVKADPMIAIMGWPAGWCYGPDCEGNPAIASAEYDALYERARLGATLDEVAPLVKQMDMMIIENVWALWGPIDPLFNVQWPWVKGYTNEGDLGGAQRGQQFVRMWIDQELKAAMGF